MNQSTTDISDPQHPVKIERFTRSLKCALNDTEILQRARRSAAIAGQIAKAEADRDAANAHHNGAIKLLRAERGNLDQEVNDGATHRDVEVQRRFNYRLGVVLDVRMDTDPPQTIPGSERPLSNEERQIENGLKDPVQPANDDGDEPTDPEPKLETEKRKGRGGRKGGGK